MNKIANAAKPNSATEPTKTSLRVRTGLSAGLTGAPAKDGIDVMVYKVSAP